VKKKKHKKKPQATDVLNSVKASQRLEEIRLHGKPICVLKIRKSKKAYTRKAKHKKSNQEIF